MLKPIILWTPSRISTTDDAGTNVIKTILPPIPPPGPYEGTGFPRPRGYLPPLTHYCIRQLSSSPEQLHVIGSLRLPYVVPKERGDYDPIRALALGFRHDKLDYDWTQVDPRLWATIVQTFTDLPDNCYCYPIPLSDKYVPQLQRIPSSSHFSLVTVLDLPGVPELNDDTIILLKELRTLAGLNAALTLLTSHGIKRLARTLGWIEGDLSQPACERQGPWGLRVLSLRRCEAIDNTVIPELRLFPLLSTIDLRGSKCTPRALRDLAGFGPCRYSLLQHPTSIVQSLDALAMIKSWDTEQKGKLFASARPFKLHIKTLHHRDVRPKNVTRPSTVNEGIFTILPESKPKEIDKRAPFPSALLQPHPAQVLTREMKQVSSSFAAGSGRQNGRQEQSELLNLREAENTSNTYGYNDTKNHSNVNFSSAPEDGSTSRLFSELDELEIYDSDSSESAVHLESNNSWTASLFYGNRTLVRDKARGIVPNTIPVEDVEDIDPLVLYRPPPHWSLLESLSPASFRPASSLVLAKSSAKVKSEQGVQLGTRTDISQGAVRDLKNMISKRRRTEINTNTSLGCLPSGFAPSRNPFIRKSASSGVLDQVFNNAQEDNDNSKPLSSKKILRPISALPIPQLPQPSSASTSEPLKLLQKEVSMSQKRAEFNDIFSLSESSRTSKASRDSTDITNISTSSLAPQLGNSKDEVKNKSLKKNLKSDKPSSFNWDAWSKS